MKTGALYCAIVDNYGFIRASEPDKCITKLIEKKIISLYKQMVLVKVIDFYHKVEVITLIEDFDVVLKGFLMIVKEFAHDRTLVAIIPPWFNIKEVLQEFKKLLKKLSKYFIEFKTQEITECLVLHP
jgi:hypothetical protein